MVKVLIAAAIMMAVFIFVLPKYFLSQKSKKTFLEKRFTVAMGSCNKQDLPQSYWPVIANKAPDVFLWMGDNIYADTDDITVMATKYQKQSDNRFYAGFKAKISIIGTWDDHDFGLNNAGGESPNKPQRQKLFLDFIGEPVKSARRSQEGVYTSYTYGPNAHPIKVIVLDTRYHRDSPKKNPDGTVLGETQFRWLKKELRESKASTHILVSSISVLSPRFGFSEEWADLPKAHDEFMDLLIAEKPKGLIILTGDRHFSGILKQQFKGRDFFELMSSGLTHSQKFKERRTKLSALYGKDNVYYDPSFATLTFLFAGRTATANFTIFDMQGEKKIERRFQISNNQWQQSLVPH